MLRMLDCVLGMQRGLTRSPTRDLCHPLILHGTGLKDSSQKNPVIIRTVYEMSHRQPCADGICKSLELSPRVWQTGPDWAVCGLMFLARKQVS